MFNPLKAPILELLNKLEPPVKEYDLIQHLHRTMASFPVRTENATLALFQTHFLVMNALYSLQSELLEQNLYLKIHPLEIQLYGSSSTASANQHLTEQCSAKLKEYYLDWRNFSDTDQQQVEQLLGQFWQQFYNRQDEAKSLHCLAVDADASWTDIQKQYRKLALTHHPDKGGDGKKFIEIQQAYEVLKNLHRRQDLPSSMD